MTDDKFLLGLVGFLSALPVLLLSPIVGVVVDRFDRARVLLATQAFMASTLFTLATLDALGILEVYHILIIATLAGAASAFDWPARLSLVPNLVERRRLQSAVAFNSASFNGARIAGPAIGGFLIGIIGTAACFYLSAFAFLPSMFVLMTLAIDRAVASEHRESPIQNLFSGYRYIWTFPTLRSLLSVDLIPVMFGMSFFALLPALTRDVYDQGSKGLGLLYSADGAGAFAGVMIVATLTGLRHRGKLVLTFVTLFAVFLILFALAPNLSVGMLLIFLMGLVGAVRDAGGHADSDDYHRPVSRTGDGRLLDVLGADADRLPAGRLGGKRLGHANGDLRQWLRGACLRRRSGDLQCRRAQARLTECIEPKTMFRRIRRTIDAGRPPTPVRTLSEPT